MAAAKKLRKAPPAPVAANDPLEPLRIEKEQADRERALRPAAPSYQDCLEIHSLEVGVAGRVYAVCRDYFGTVYRVALTESAPADTIAHEHAERIRAALAWDWRRS
jgi:hypothetical protein